VSKNDDPWLLDLEIDPDELTNFILEPGYNSVVEELATDLKKYVNKFDDPFLLNTKMADDLNALLSK